MFNRDMFRKTALDKLSTPDDLDELLQVNSKFSWFLMVSLLCLILAGFGWGLFGRIVNKVPMTGTIQPVDPPRSLVATHAGQVDSVFYKPGDRVRKNQAMAGYIPVGGAIKEYILAPFDGEIIELNVSEGDFLMAGTTVAKIGRDERGSTNHPEFLFFVSAESVSQLAVGQRVNLLIQGRGSESRWVDTWIIYLGKLPASHESVNSIILDEEVAARLNKGNNYLVRTVYIPMAKESDPFEFVTLKELYGKIFRGEAIISQNSPIAYLLTPSKNN